MDPDKVPIYPAIGDVVKAVNDLDGVTDREKQAAIEYLLRPQNNWELPDDTGIPFALLLPNWVFIGCALFIMFFPMVLLMICICTQDKVEYDDKLMDVSGRMVPVKKRK